MQALANAPSRATNNIRLGLGLMSIEVQLFTATEETKPVERHQHVRSTGNPVGYKKYDKVTGDLVADGDIANMVVVDDALIELTDDEILSATAGAAVDKGNVEIQEFVPLAALDSEFLVDTGRLYQVRPALRKISDRKKVPDVRANTLFNLMMAVMADRQVAALFRVGLRGSARYCVLTPDAHVRFLYFPDEIRAPLPVPAEEFGDKDFTEMGMLIDVLTVDELPELTNDAKEAITEFLAQKAAGKTPAVPVATAPEAVVLDLSAALEASLAAAKTTKGDSARGIAKKPTKKKAA